VHLILISTDHANQDLTADSAREKYTTERLLKNGVRVVFRPVECGDEAKFKEFFKNLSPKSIHYRFLEMVKELPHESVERFCDLDFGREMAIVVLPESDDEIIGVVRLMVNRGLGRGEFALVVADECQGFGLGAELVDYVIKIARDYGLMELYCTVSSDNLRMVGLAEKFGMKVKSTDGDTIEMTLRLA
jgi:acetyltransferase